MVILIMMITLIKISIVEAIRDKALINKNGWCIDTNHGVKSRRVYFPL
jgi:hypothetical protein